MTLANQYQHWTVFQDEDDIIWVSIDRVDSSVNTFSEAVLAEFSQVLDYLYSQPQARAVVFTSAKDNGFVYGADIKEFSQLTDKKTMVRVVRNGQTLFDRVATLPMPTIALIEGICVGGGLEFILACRYRIADDDSKTKFSFPEVKLGLHPGWGGMIRLPRLLGAISAMDMILSGRMVSAHAAAKLGLVDVSVPKRQLRHAVQHYAFQQPKPHRATFLQRLSNQAWCRSLLAKLFYKKLTAKVNPKHYPAPFAALTMWNKHGVNGDQAFSAEAASFVQLMCGEVAKNLGRVFLLQERLKSQAKKTDVDIKYVHVVGAGVMGGDIAAWCALQGLQVSLQDREPKLIAPAIKRAHQLFENKLKNHYAVQEVMDRLMPDAAGAGIVKADVIIEAIFENLAAKQALFKEVEAKAKPDAILATNTSTIPLNDINKVLDQPNRLIGLHFFNPVARMPLVEVVKTSHSGKRLIQRAIDFVRIINKLPLPVKSAPGFLVNHTLIPYIVEAVMLLDEDIPPEAVDKAATNFGMPMGPIELLDTVGLDIGLAAAEELAGTEGFAIPSRLKEMVEQGNLGKKTGKGFYTYKKGKAIKKKLPKNYSPPEDIVIRLICRMLNQLAGCLWDSIIDDTDLADAGMIFGTGFAPFRGGPMHYAKKLGKIAVQQQFIELERHYGQRFKYSKGWELVFGKQT